VEQEKLDLILEAGRLAPTARNEQRNRVVVVRDEKLRAGLQEACNGQKFVSQAPVSLVVCADNDRPMPCGISSRSIDCAIALSFMYVEALEQGLQGCWLGAFNQDRVRELLGIPADFVVTAVMPLGYPAEPVATREKKPIGEFATYDKF
jgi:nitroreductase